MRLGSSCQAFEIRPAMEYLEDHHNDHFNQLFGHGVDKDGFREVRGKKFGILNSWVKGAPIRLASTRPVLELFNANLNDMSAVERSALHKYWVQQRHYRTQPPFPTLARFISRHHSFAPKVPSGARSTLPTSRTHHWCYNHRPGSKLRHSPSCASKSGGD